MKFSAPPLWRTALELRAPLELAGLLAGTPFTGLFPTGDGHTVLVLPGFMGPDASTVPMRRLLRKQGWNAVGWGLGVNVGPRAHVIAGLRHRLASLASEQGAPVSIVGWSLGGLYARTLARLQPGAVRNVITMASPVRMETADTSRVSVVYEFFETPGERESWAEIRRLPLNTPTTSLFTKTDGIVQWEACIVTGPCSESIEVRGASHFGIGQNLAALYAVSDRLRQKSGSWKPFVAPRGLRQLLRAHPPLSG